MSERTPVQYSTAMETTVVDSPPQKRLAWMVYCVAGESSVAVPESLPVLESMEMPTGSAGVMVKS